MVVGLVSLGMAGTIAACGAGATTATSIMGHHHTKSTTPSPRPSTAPSSFNNQSVQQVIHTSGNPFDPTISEAMQYLRRRSATFPYMAPTEGGFVPTVPHLAALATTNARGYTVNLFSSDKRLPINSPILSTAPYEQAGAIVGSFGGTSYASPSTALASLYLSPAQSIAPAYQPPPNVPDTEVYLGKGIYGLEYVNDTATVRVGTPMVVWHEGDWTLEVWDGSVAQDVAHAKKLVGYLHSHLLPETFGVVGENIARDGDHTTVEWVYGNRQYSAFNYRSGLQAVEMAASARVFPSGEIRP